MINNIKVKNYKGIRDINLIGLGGCVNILAGRNNSGKSSILEAINDSTKRSIGLSFQESNIEELWNLYKPLITTSRPSSDQILNTLRQFLKEYEGECLFKEYTADYVNKFNAIFTHLYRENYGNNYQFDRLLTKVFMEYEEGFLPCLINPKRKIDFGDKIDTAAGLSMDGGNLLNHLFYLKNQVPYSKAYGNFTEIFNKFKKVTGGCEFNICPDRGNHIRLQFKMVNHDEWLDASNCGLGIREILLVVAFVVSPDYNFVQIEEPENHLHPEYQRELLRLISSSKNKQFLISTHSNIFLDTSYVDKVFLVRCDDQVHIQETTTRVKVLNELGYSSADNLVSDLVILTEGPKDFPVIEEFLRMMGVVDEYVIKFWPLGGDIMSQIDLTCLKETNKLIALIDKDPKSQKERNRFKRHCAELDIECFQLQHHFVLAISQLLFVLLVRKIL